jgi:hypothetical protein
MKTKAYRKETGEGKKATLEEERKHAVKEHRRK